MGFFINDYENELRQHLNLSTYAWYVIYNDILDFYYSENERTISGFLNRIFTNFNNQAKASISKRILDKEEEINNFLLDDSFEKIDKNIKILFKSKSLENYMKVLIKDSKSYPKGEGKKFRINKANVELLRDSEDSKYYNNSIGLYLKAIFEEYVRLPNYKREEIFFLDKITLINYAISKQLKLKITLLPRTNVNKEQIALKFYVSPYKIIQDKSNHFNYLVGYSEQIIENNQVLEKSEASFRLSRIDRIALMNSMNGFISIEHKKELDENIIKKDVRFLSSKLEKVKIRFSDKGSEHFIKQIYMRPMHYEKCPNEKNTYIFYCTEIQAMDYFFKIGKHIEILEPKSLRENFKKRYYESYKVYED